MQLTTETVVGWPKRSRQTLFAASLAVMASTPIDLAQARIIEFDPPQSANTVPYSINESGAIVGYYVNGEEHGFLRSPDGKITTIDVPVAECGTDAMSINREGTITGVYKDGSCNAHGYVRAVDGTITTFDVSGAAETAPESVNDKGKITGFYNSGNEQHGFIRAAGGKIRTFDPNGSTETIPQSINKSGVIAGTYNVSSGFVRAVNGTITSFNVQNGATYANCINDSGYVVGEYYTNDTFVGFLRSPEGGSRR